MVVTACGSSSDSDDESTATPTAGSSPSTAAPSQSLPASASPSPAPSSPAPSTPTGDPVTSEPPAPPSPTAAALFPGHKVQQLEDSVIANRESYGKGWPWKTSDVVMACSDSIGGGAYLNAADGENYLLTGTITQQGFVKSNAGTELWNGKDGDAYAEWLDAGAKLCPDAA